MTQDGKGKKQGSGIVVRVSTQTKNRLDKLRHPGQSYEGFLEELLNFWEETHAVKGFQAPVQQPMQQPVQQSPDGQPAGKAAGNPSWWWWPQADKVPGNGD